MIGMNQLLQCMSHRNDRFDTLDYLILRLDRFDCLLHLVYVTIKEGESIPVDARRIQRLKMTAGLGDWNQPFPSMFIIFEKVDGG